MGATDNVIGTLVSHHGNHAEFVIESVRPSTKSPGVVVPALAVGQHVKVHFDGSTAQFLHVGSRYAAGLWWLNGEFWSDIHTADRPCSGGTGYADGSSIDTSLWARSQVREGAYVVVVGTVAVIVTRRIRAMHRRRRRAQIAER